MLAVTWGLQFLMLSVALLLFMFAARFLILVLSVEAVFLWSGRGLAVGRPRRLEPDVGARALSLRISGLC